MVYAGSLAVAGTYMCALDARTGAILWSFASGGSVTGGAAIADGSVYWARATAAPNAWSRALR